MKVLDTSTIIAEWEKDSRINRTELGSEALRTSELHSKYITMLAHIKRKSREIQSRLDTLQVDREEYYKGVHPEDNYPLKILKTDISKYIKADEQIQPILNELKEMRDCEYIVEQILKCVNSLGFQIGNAITWEKFKNGLN